MGGKGKTFPQLPVKIPLQLQKPDSPTGHRIADRQSLAVDFPFPDLEYSRCGDPEPGYQLYLSGPFCTDYAFPREDERGSAPKLDIDTPDYPDQYFICFGFFYQIDEPAHFLFRYPHDWGYHASDSRLPLRAIRSMWLGIIGI